MLSFRKSLAAGALALGAVAAFGSAAQAQIIFQQPQVQGQVVIPQPTQQTLAAYTTLTLNLRAGPGTQYPVILSMPTNSMVYVFYCGDISQPWCYVNFNGYEGWASARYLTQNAPYVQQPTYPQPTYPQPVYPTPGYPQVYTPQQIFPGAPMGGNFGLWFYVQ